MKAECRILTRDPVSSSVFFFFFPFLLSWFFISKEGLVRIYKNNKLQRVLMRKFPGGSVVRTVCSHNSIPGLGTKILQAARPKKKKKEKKSFLSFKGGLIYMCF